jgi:hypothetical protein
MEPTQILRNFHCTGLPGRSSTASPMARNVVRALWVLSCFWLGVAPAFAQTVFLDFNTAGQYTGNFNQWNDVGGADGGNYGFVESATGGAGGSGCVSVFASTDTTATYNSGSWNFSTNGAVIIVSTMVVANGQTSGNKVQLGILNANNNGLNSNPGIAFESYRFVPQSATSWSLREQYRTTNTTTETTLGNVTVAAGHWYKFVVGVTNTSGGSGNFNAGCALYDFGTDGLTPGPNIVTVSTLESHTGQDIASAAAVWPGLRAFQNAGINAWDNFLVFTPASAPVITMPLTNTTVLLGATADFNVLAEGPGAISYAWYTNGILVSGASGSTYTTPPVSLSFSTIAVVASNANGSVTNSANITVVRPAPPQVANLPATGIRAELATLNGQVIATGGYTPNVTLFYGPTDGGTNAGVWAHSVSLGAESGSFAQTVTGLSSNTTYYFTAEAVNTIGAAWAVPSQKFTTLLSDPVPPAFAAVFTQHNDLNRSGANLNEPFLNTGNVNTNAFGLLYTRPVDDQIYAQPLVMTNVTIPGKGIHNLLYLCTVNDSVYAYDAEDPAVSLPYWQTNFLGPNVVAPANSDMTGACGGAYMDFSGHLGIVGTPVIDPAAGTMYLVVRTKEFNTNFVQRLHALDITTGAERSNSPVIITATYPGTGPDSVNGLITFDPQHEDQRPGLALVNGVVYISWSSHCDWTPYHGWVIGYDATSLKQVAQWVDTPNGTQGGIWMSGGAPAADPAGNLYLSTGNGTVDGADRGESFVRLTRNSGSTNLTLSSWFTPYNYQTLNNNDQDLGSGGVLLVPGTSLLFSGGKGGVAYLVNRDNMGGLSLGSADTNIVESFTVTTDEVHGGPIWWDGPGASYAYIWPSSVYLQQYLFNSGLGTLITPPLAQSPTPAPGGQPGGILALSANGTNAGSGIVWAVHQLGGDANQQVLPGILHAYDAQNVTNELWNSEQLTTRDTVGNFAKFVPPRWPTARCTWRPSPTNWMSMGSCPCRC